jgi:hypothetical protein
VVLAADKVEVRQSVLTRPGRGAGRVRATG